MIWSNWLNKILWAIPEPALFGIKSFSASLIFPRLGSDGSETQFDAWIAICWENSVVRANGRSISDFTCSLKGSVNCQTSIPQKGHFEHWLPSSPYNCLINSNWILLKSAKFPTFINLQNEIKLTTRYNSGRKFQGFRCASPSSKIDIDFHYCRVLNLHFHFFKQII